MVFHYKFLIFIKLWQPEIINYLCKTYSMIICALYIFIMFVDLYTSLLDHSNLLQIKHIFKNCFGHIFQ